MNIAEKTVLITAPHRGIGPTLVNEGLHLGVKRVYAGTGSALQSADERMTPLRLNVSSVSQIQRAVDHVDTLDLVTPVSDLSVSSYSETSRNIDSAELIQRVKALEAEKLRLETLVCYLLHKNEQLRSRNLDGNSHFGERSIPNPTDDKKKPPRTDEF